MGSHRATRPHAGSHARPRGGRARSAVLALGVITVTAGVGATLAGDWDKDGAAGRVETDAAGDLPTTGDEDSAAGGASPLATPTGIPGATASPSPGATTSAAPKRKQTLSPADASRTAARAATQKAGGGTSGGTGGSGTGSGSGSGGPASGTTGGSGGSDTDDPSSPEAQVLALVNQERASAGCSPLKANANLTQAADDYSDVMARSGVMSHTGPDGSTMTSRVEAAGYRWSTLGENIARGQSDAAAVMKAWMNSPGHRANILNCSFTELGVGVHFGDGGPWWTQNFGAGR
ncbi:CAP domain-containing protein [Streptomyces sp. NPDC003023]|uniref:CAP domain-containing protein n=1 Tax=Streptomyces sp. NPDC003023 TaxID=3364675 RepID=UPI00369A3177